MVFLLPLLFVAINAMRSVLTLVGKISCYRNDRYYSMFLVSVLFLAVSHFLVLVLFLLASHLLVLMVFLVVISHFLQVCRIHTTEMIDGLTAWAAKCV